MRLQISFLKPTNPKIQKFCKKGSSLGAIQPSKISPFEAKSIQVFSKSAQLFIHRLKFQKTISRFPGQECSFRNQKNYLMRIPIKI
jgi:t-SNARE complex subunit (syntaxin)